MKNRKKSIAAFFPLLLAVCTVSLPLQAQAASPAVAQALSAASMSASEELSAATAKAIESGVHSLTDREPELQPVTNPVPHISQGTELRVRQKIKSSIGSVKARLSPDSETPEPPAPPRPYDARHTLHVTVSQRKLQLEAPLDLCFLDRTTALQQSIHLMISAAAEKNDDQVLLGVFMDCNSVSSPDSWYDGMPNTGFVTWLNPGIGSTTRMGLPDYLDMREASFTNYAKGRNIGSHPDKTVHRTPHNVSLAFIDKAALSDGSERDNISIVATTLLRQVPIEVTLHIRGDASANKAAPDFAKAYAMMDQLMAQLIKLNQ